MPQNVGVDMSAEQNESVLPHADGVNDAGNGQQAEPCYLLRLAPELRNRIYEYALVKNRRIRINKKLRPPPLLHTCKQIKGEATKMWLRQNRFRVHIRRYDASHLITFNEVYREALDELLVKEADLEILCTLSGRPHWANLKMWCKSVYDGLLGYPSHHGSHDEDETIATAALIIAGKEPKWQWEYCEGVLEQLREVAGKLNRDWLKYYPTTQNEGSTGSA